MGYRSLRQCVNDLERNGHLVRIDAEIDPHLEIAEVQRRVFRAEGPAVYFSRVKGCRFPVVCNLFGTMQRVRFIFRDTLAAVRRAVELKIDPAVYASRPWKYLSLAGTAVSMLPKRVKSGPLLSGKTSIRELPQIVSWPQDGGAFITLPQVYTENVETPGIANSNLGMYRVQLSGGEYEPDREVGLHYQIHRGIGVHHAAALRQGKPFRVNVFVGGPPAMTLAAVMPLPEGFPEIYFAGALAGRRIRMIGRGPEELPLHADADFCLSGYVDPEKQLPEGPFGDHLGYYSLTHDFPVLRVEHVYHREDAIWPYTSVGRPPQEDTMFGEIIHEITGPAIPAVIPGVQAVHAVDAAGVHPLLLAIGSERYVPYAERVRPQELLTQAHAILGQGQLSLAKYLLMVAEEDNPRLDVHDIPAFLAHLLARIDWQRDLHFQTCTTIDTLDYSGSGFNEGSKVVLAAVGPPRRELPGELPGDFSVPDPFREPRIALPGVLVVQGPKYEAGGNGRDEAVAGWVNNLDAEAPLNRFPLVVVVDDSEFTARSESNFLWTTFTRSDPARDLYGVESFVHEKHWGCRGSLIIDARHKPWMPEPLVEDPTVCQRLDELAAASGPLAGLW